MKKSAIILVMTLFGVLAFSNETRGQSAANQKTSETIEKLDDDINKMLLESDYVTLKKHLTDDFIYIKSAGIQLDRNAYLQKMKTIKYESFSSREVKVRMYGDAAIVTGRLAAMWEGGSGRFLYTRVYVWNKDKWQLARGHATVMN